MPLTTIPARFCQGGQHREIQQAWLAEVEAICRQFNAKVSSAWRSKAANDAAGGASDSDHLRGDAADFVGGSRDMQALHEWASGRFPYVEPMTQAKDHVHISFRHGGVSTPAAGGLKNLHPLKGEAFVKALKRSAERHEVDWLAAAAVGMPEGHSGKIGDNGSSYGPWQMHIGGALPKRWARLGRNDPRTNAWCWSAPGIDYAIGLMAKAGARRQRGELACTTIVYDFEHPTHPAAETKLAIAAYHQLAAAKPSAEAAVATWFGGPSGGGAIPTYTPPPATPSVQAPRASGAWAELMRILGRHVPAQAAKVRASGDRLHKTID
jgi:hypothetical protein